jgi:hypothetical protein
MTPGGPSGLTGVLGTAGTGAGGFHGSEVEMWGPGDGVGGVWVCVVAGPGSGCSGGTTRTIGGGDDVPPESEGPPDCGVAGVARATGPGSGCWCVGGVGESTATSGGVCGAG